MKILALATPNLSIWRESHELSLRTVEQSAEFWKRDIAVVALALNARLPEHDNSISVEHVRLFDQAMLRRVDCALYLMPDWEKDDHCWHLLALANKFKRPVFINEEDVFRWRDGDEKYLENQLRIKRKIPRLLNEPNILFTISRYFAGTPENPDYGVIDNHIAIATRLSLKLWQMGFLVFTPHNNTRHFEVRTAVSEDIYQEFDRIIGEQLCDGAAVSDNWVLSSGGRKEVAMFSALGKPVFDGRDERSLQAWRDGGKQYFTLHHTSR